jgi:tetratricopeptide (TPR) repeat protein
MKRTIITFIILILLISGNNIAQLNDKTNIDDALKSLYPTIGTPEYLPIKFGEGIISLDSTRDRDMAISLEFDEIYFTRIINGQMKIHSMKKVEGTWTMPQLASFTDYYQSAEPAFSIDGNRLFYISTKPSEGSTEEINSNIWYLTKNGDEWTQPTRLSENIDFYPTFTKNNKVYYTDAQNDLFSANFENGQLVNRQKLGDNINTEGAEYNSFVAPDESYLIFTSFGWGDGFGGGDLYISFKDENGNWRKPVNMGGGINSNRHEYCPSLSPDGKYLFFTSNKNNGDDLYWIDANIINVLKNKNLNIANYLVSAISKDQNVNLEEIYSELEKGYSQYCFFDETVLDNVSNRLLSLNKTSEVLKTIELIEKLYPNEFNDFHKLKTAILTNDSRAYERLKQKYSRQPQLMRGRFEFNINTLGYRFLINQYIDEALKVFELYVYLLPNSSNSYDSYGEALLAKGDTTQAIVNYKKSLELNPNNNNAVQVLQALNQ